jgi:hypothetical protein
VLYFIFAICVFGLLALLILRQVRLWIGKSIKARQDLARGVADIADRMGRLESRLGESQAPKR